MALGCGQVDLEVLHLRPAACSLQARNQEPGTEAWPLASF